jgi:hypothetical protein
LKYLIPAISIDKKKEFKLNKLMKIKLSIQFFISGFISTLVFHQGTFGLLSRLKIIPLLPYNMTPTEPLGVPAVISLSFFGGLWGLLIGYFIHKDPAKKYWLKSVLLGSLGPTAIAVFVVFPIKGIAFNPAIVPIGLLLNAMWGLGLGLFILIIKKYFK